MKSLCYRKARIFKANVGLHVTVMRFHFKKQRLNVCPLSQNIFSNVVMASLACEFSPRTSSGSVSLKRASPRNTGPTRAWRPAPATVYSTASLYSRAGAVSTLDLREAGRTGHVGQALGTLHGGMSAVSGAHQGGGRGHQAAGKEGGTLHGGMSAVSGAHQGGGRGHQAAGKEGGRDSSRRDVCCQRSWPRRREGDTKQQGRREGGTLHGGMSAVSGADQGGGRGHQAAGKEGGRDSSGRDVCCQRSSSRRREGTPSSREGGREGLFREGCLLSAELIKEEGGDTKQQGKEGGRDSSRRDVCCQRSWPRRREGTPSSREGGIWWHCWATDVYNLCRG